MAEELDAAVTGLRELSPTGAGGGRLREIIAQMEHNAKPFPTLPAALLEAPADLRERAQVACESSAESSRESSRNKEKPRKS